MTGKTTELEAPGLKRMRRKNGRIDCYWVASEKAVKEKYPIKTQKLNGNPDDPMDFIQMAETCNRLQSEMLQWLDGQSSLGIRSDAGTIGWFCESFEKDKDSPYHQTRLETQKFYSKHIKTLISTIGAKSLSHVIGKDLRRWHEEWASVIGQRGAYGCVQTLRRVLSYGAGDLSNDDCLKISASFKHIKISAPPARKQKPTYEQIASFRETAHKLGRPSMALAVTLQFEFSLRQKDIIGEWVLAHSQSGILYQGKRWQWGMTWDHIDDNLILRKPTSKSNGNEIAEHDLKSSRDMMNELARIPKEKRIGPIVIEEKSGRPYKRDYFIHLFRQIADEAGWPKDLRNMDCRAGAISEAFEAGAETADVMKTATHKTVSTTMRYNRGSVVQSSRVVGLRQAKREADRT